MNKTVKGTESLALAALETESLRKRIPKAIRIVIYRISIFYVGSMTIAGLLVDHKSGLLDSAKGASAATFSPFFIAFQSIDLKELSTIVVLVAIIIISLIPILSSHLCKCLLMIIWPVGISIHNCY
jgi:amino acid permease